VSRPRKQRREHERELRKEVRRIERAAASAPGGSAEHPLPVTSSAVVELRARATPCLQCGGELELRGDRATSTPRGVLRAIDTVCRRCHAPRVLWLLIEPTAAN
jgi:hypothetical protein